MTVDLYGHTVDLQEQGDGYVTDVMVLARVIRHDEDGDTYDSILVSATPQSTGIVQIGMTHVLTRILDSPFAFDETGDEEDA